MMSDSYFMILSCFFSFCENKIAAEDVRACRTIPDLTKSQLELCYFHNDVFSTALKGFELAVKECEKQFERNRWNCSNLITKKRNPQSSNLLKKGMSCMWRDGIKIIRST